MNEATVYYSTEDKPYLCFRHAVLTALYQGKKIQTNCLVHIGSLPDNVCWGDLECVDCEKEKQEIKELEERRNEKTR